METNTETQLDNVQRVRHPGTLSSKWDSLSNFPLRVQGTLQRRKQKDCRVWRTPRKEGLPNTAGPTHICILRDCGSMHRARMGLYQMGSSTQERWTQAPILNPELSPIDNHWQREEESASMESYWVCKSHLRASPVPSSRRLTQKELNGVLRGFLSHNSLSRHYFNFIFSL